MPVIVPILCLVDKPIFNFIVRVIVPTLVSVFKIHCASILSRKRTYLDFIVPAIVPLLFLVKETMLNFIVPVIVHALASKFSIYCASMVILGLNLLFLLLCLL